ncbi:MAG: hypothetical protein QM602_12040 [Microbacterium sp.]
MNEPQVWVLIGVFTTIMLGGMTLMTSLINRATAAAIGGLRAEMNARFDAVNARFDAVNDKIDHVDRDVTFLMRRAWDEPTAD